MRSVMQRVAAISTELVENACRTRTPSSADGGLSSISTPVMRSGDAESPVNEAVVDASLVGAGPVARDGEADADMNFSNNWSSPLGFLSPLSDLEVTQDEIMPVAHDDADFDDVFDLNDGFTLPPPMIDVESLPPSEAGDEEILCGAGQVQDTAAEVLTQPLQAVEAQAQKCLPACEADNEVSRRCHEAVILRKEKASLVAALEHCSLAAAARREQLRRRGAVRVGRRRVACRARPTAHTQIITATARRCQPWAGAR